MPAPRRRDPVPEPADSGVQEREAPVERTVEPAPATPLVQRVTEPAGPDPSAGTGYMRAVEPLCIGSTLCHVPGDLVPAENVARNGWRDKVMPLTVEAEDARSGSSADV